MSGIALPRPQHALGRDDVNSAVSRMDFTMQLVCRPSIVSSIASAFNRDKRVGFIRKPRQPEMKAAAKATPVRRLASISSHGADVLQRELLASLGERSPAMASAVVRS